VEELEYYPKLCRQQDVELLGLQLSMTIRILKHASNEEILHKRSPFSIKRLKLSQPTDY
jgi:hypothetical protein